MYNIFAYGSMIGDRQRAGAYARALRRAVKPGAVVLDLGCGTGFFALLACQFGAGRVYAVEPDGVIEVAKKIARANGYADRIEFIQDLSSHIILPELADVVVADIRGVLPVFGHSLPAIIDARRRLLAPGGILIPQCDTLWAAMVEAPDLYRSYTAPWEDNGFGFQMEAARVMATNFPRRKRILPEQLLVKPQCWATLNYADLESANVSGELSWTLERPGVAHGLAVWFDAVLMDGVEYSNAPGAPELIYSQFFFPLPQPVNLSAGDQTHLSLKADLIGENYTWRWHTTFLEPGISGPVKAEFKQSDFLGESWSLPRLRKLADRFVPNLNMSGEIDRFILTKMTGETSLAEIAHQLVVQFPKTFTTFLEALTRVGEMSEKYSS